MWVLIIVMVSSVYGGSDVEVHMQEFTSKNNCIFAVNAIKKNGTDRYRMIQCVPK